MNAEHVTGMASELKAAHWFASEGYEIYWPMASQSKADFVVDNGDGLQKVQVKTATWSKTGKYLYLQARLSSSNANSRKYYEKGDFDHIVFIDGDSMWLASFEEVEGRTSVYLDTTNPTPNKSKRNYNPEDWRIS